MILAQNHLLPLNGNRHDCCFMIFKTYLMNFRLIIFLSSLTASIQLVAQSTNLSRVNIPEKKDRIIENEPKLISKEVNAEQLSSFSNNSLLSKYKTSIDSSLISQEPLQKTKITLLLSFDKNHASWKMSASRREEDPAVAKNIKVKESSTDALDFLEGFQLAFKNNPPFLDFDIHVMDATANDSILKEKLKNSPEIQNSDIIIGPGKVSAAKIVADYCKKNKKLNIQPFVASPFIGFENPYLVKLAPTIEGHMLSMFQTIVDTFPNAKVVIYTTNKDRDLLAAKYIDSLFDDYNSRAKIKISKVYVNAGDMTKTSNERSLGANMGGGRQNIVIYCSYDQVQINQTLRGISRGSAIVFGMPTWVDQELIRADYINNSSLHFTKAFYADTSEAQVISFINQYKSNYTQHPSEASFLGYDVANYLSYSLKLYGYNFAEMSIGNRFIGLGHNFLLSSHMAKTKDNPLKSFQYFMNECVHLYRVNNFAVEHVR